MANAKHAEPQAAWPVEKASDLTIDHLPQKLLDEIERPWRARLKVLANLSFNVMDHRNDLVSGFERLGKEARKDSISLNKELAEPSVRDALVASGVVKDAKELEVES